MTATSSLPGSAGGRTPVFRFGYWLVLPSIVVSYAVCAAQGTANPSAVALLVQLATVALILWVAEAKPGIRRAGMITLSTAAVAVTIVWLIGAQGHLLDIVLSGASMLAYLAAPVVIIAHQVRKKHVDGQSLLAAIAAYILVGMFFTFVYNFIALTSASPIFGDGQVESLTSQMFFSFTTLTTTGYGDKVPSGAGVQSVAIAEAIAGQLFLVIAVARVVSGWKPPTER
ncbi:ion channel [Arthrobacter glacialis]|uniref:Potassium channel domain-containing protein n=1 Tax=Arthrobacter glacialis TaxID=1664 RepID=A0A2S3ZU25_ARTGL|nr:ion channel [Arthrobacter glacialis]POH57790.1 hypothetical protein CVS28_13520 [Arthrobacter glacialis]POH72594.1 hypothetical protein CVS27_14535 [Arthrobacter glacialis]